MKSKTKLLLFLSLFFWVKGFSKNELAGSSFVTYEFSGGRFGDNLLAYIHGKWVAYKYGLPLLYKPFPCSDQLVLHDIDPVYEEVSGKRIKKVHFFEINGQLLTKSKGGATLYIVPYFPEFEYEQLVGLDRGNRWSHFPIGWDDKNFQSMIASLIQPKSDLQLLDVPKDVITVAMHIRRGGGFDSDKLFTDAPLKAPPDQFYIDALKTIQELVDKQPLYVYVFTDDREPTKFTEKFKKEFASAGNIIFKCREQGNIYSANILEDFFSMMQFDCLIRPDSNYSYIASKIHDYEIVLSPASVKWVDNKPIIDQIKVEPGKL